MISVEGLKVEFNALLYTALITRNLHIPNNSTVWYGLYLTKVRSVPWQGTSYTMVRYKPYQGKVQKDTPQFISFSLLYTTENRYLCSLETINSLTL